MTDRKSLKERLKIGSSPAHTPGPWTLCPGWPDIYGPNQETVLALSEGPNRDDASRIVVCVNAMEPGGAVAVVAALARAWREDGHHLDPKQRAALSAVERLIEEDGR